MNIPAIIYHVAKVLAIISLIIEVGIGVASVFYMLGSEYESTTPALDGAFCSGVKVRNSSLCFLILLFFVANKSTRIKGISALASISSVCKIYAVGSLVVFAIGIVVSLVIAAKKITSEAVKKYGGRIWREGMLSSLFCFCLAYFFYIP